MLKETFETHIITFQKLIWILAVSNRSPKRGGKSVPIATFQRLYSDNSRSSEHCDL